MTGPERPGEHPVTSLLGVAWDAARAAVDLIHHNRPGTLRVETKSSATDHVTQMDLASEQMIRDTIARSRPGDAVLGEEHGGLMDPDRVTWVIDPIDGTTNYVYDHPGYAVSIAAWISGEPVVGVVADPTHERTYWAAAGAGAHCALDSDRPPGTTSAMGGQPWGSRLVLADPPPLERMLVATGFGYDPQRRGAQGRVVASLLPRIRDIRRMGAAALDLCSTASGRVDAYYEVGLSIWDLAAGWLVATESGAAVEAIEGGAPRPGSVLVAHPRRIGELRDLLFDCGVQDIIDDP